MRGKVAKIRIKKFTIQHFDYEKYHVLKYPWQCKLVLYGEIHVSHKLSYDLICGCEEKFYVSSWVVITSLLYKFALKRDCIMLAIKLNNFFNFLSFFSLPHLYLSLITQIAI
jgi:hypothetical protein